MISVLIFDDSPERRASLMALFDISDDYQCIGAFSDCNEIEKHLIKLKPDVILMDIKMPGMNGVDATRLVKKVFPTCKVIIQTIFFDDETIFNSLKAGAEGYILKNSGTDKILQAIHDVYHGGAVITPSIALRVTNFFNELKRPESSDFESQLTAREKEVLHLLTQGLSYKMVAAKLDISYHTVNTHIRKIYQKLSVNSMSEAISMALKNKIV